MASDSVAIWPRLEPFLLGVLQLAPPSKLSLHYLRKMSLYVRTRDGCFPALRWPMWRHIACGKLQLQEELAWIYLETFDLLGALSPQERLERADCLFQCSTKEEENQERNKLSVNTLQFLLFLYIQQLNRVSLRTSLIGEEWPGQRSTSPSPSEKETKTNAKSKNWDDQAHLSFLQSRLGEILELLLEPDQQTRSGAALRQSQLSLQAVQSLSLLLEGSAGPGKPVQPLHRLLTRGPLQTESGFSPQSRCFSLQQLLSCLQNRLSLNPYGMSACMRSWKSLYWGHQVEDSLKRLKMVGNIHSAPAGSQTILMSQVRNQTLPLTSQELNGTNVKIHRCSDAYIYLLSPLRSVSVEKCRDCTVVLGPVETSVYVHGCHNLRVVCVTRRLSVGASSHCSVHTLTPTRPLLLPGNKALTLGPFHTFYPTLEDHMAAVGLAVVPNVWDQPLLLGSDGLVHSAPPPDACYRLLPPQEFAPLAVPFKMDGETSEVPGGLPPAYQAVEEEKRQSIKNWQRTVMEGRLDEDQRRHFLDVVDQSFRSWLQETGNSQELDSLIRNAAANAIKTSGAAAPSPTAC